MLADQLGAVVIAAVSAGGTILVAWLKLRGDSQASLPAAYQGLLTEVKDWTRQQLEQRDKQIEVLQHDVEELQQAVKTWKSKFRSAVRYIHQLRGAVGDRARMPPPPPDIEGDLE